MFYNIFVNILDSKVFVIGRRCIGKALVHVFVDLGLTPLHLGFVIEIIAAEGDVRKHTSNTVFAALISICPEYLRMVLEHIVKNNIDGIIVND